MEEDNHYFFLFILILLALLLVFKFKASAKFRNQLPPSPPSFPIIGHLHIFKKPLSLHRVLQKLSDKYGSILSLSLGSRLVIVVSSPAAVQACFTKNDIIFANRPRLLSGKYFSYNYTSIGFAPYGPHWRNLRRLAVTQLLSTHRLNLFRSVREDELKLWVKELFDMTRNGFVRVEMKSKLNELSFNTVMRMLCGKRYFGVGVESEDCDEANEFRDFMKEILQLSGASNPGDFLPILRMFDYEGLEKRMVKARGRADAFLQTLIDRIRREKSSCGHGRTTTTMIHNLLSLQETEPEYYSDDIIKGHILSILGAGTDTSTGTIEWGLTLLLNHPTVMNKAQNEINEFVGKNRLVTETDLIQLPYLQAIINETLRLFPAAPVLVPHQSSQDCTVEGFHVPKGTMLLANVWAIHRDPKLWDDPMSFKPERFENWDLETETNYKWLPFGMGRRTCPGAGLAYKVVGLTLAALIQCFEWDRIGEDEIDLDEGTGITMPKANPLEAMCKVRSSMITVLSHI